MKILPWRIVGQGELPEIITNVCCDHIGLLAQTQSLEGIASAQKEMMDARGRLPGGVHLFIRRSLARSVMKIYSSEKEFGRGVETSYVTWCVV